MNRLLTKTLQTTYKPLCQYLCSNTVTSVFISLSEEECEYVDLYRVLLTVPSDETVL